MVAFRATETTATTKSLGQFCPVWDMGNNARRRELCEAIMSYRYLGVPVVAVVFVAATDANVRTSLYGDVN